jgi:cytoskeletal protein RodZ
MTEPQYPTTRTNENQWLWWALGAIVLALLAIWLFQSFSSPTPETPDTGTATTSTSSTGTPTSSTGTDMSTATTTVAGVVANPNQYADQTITVQGVVGQVYASRIIVLNEPASSGGRGILVASPQPITAVAGDNVTVSGKAYVGVIKALLSRFGLSVPAGIENNVSGSVIIVANTITEAVQPTQAPVQ